jgi:hypothetical protein
MSGVAIGAVADPGVAHADGSCWGDYCTGQNPYSSGCASDAYVWGTANLTYKDSDGNQQNAGTIQLIVSPSCGTRWAYATLTDSDVSGVQVEAKQDTGFTEETPWYNNGAGTYYTEMTYSRTHCSQAIVYYSDNNSGNLVGGNSGQTGCGTF